MDGFQYNLCCKVYCTLYETIRMSCNTRLSNDTKLTEQRFPIVYIENTHVIVSVTQLHNTMS